MAPPTDHATRLTLATTRGDEASRRELSSTVYAELRRIAGREASPNHTLQPTALAHEAYLCLVRHEDVGWEGRAHFLAVAAKATRRVLRQYERGRRAEKRGGAMLRVVLSDDIALASEGVDTAVLNEVLDRLAEVDERQARIVEMRYFGGLSQAEIAAVLGLSTRTVRRDLVAGHTWIARELAPKEDE